VKQHIQTGQIIGLKKKKQTGDITLPEPSFFVFHQHSLMGASLSLLCPNLSSTLSASPTKKKKKKRSATRLNKHHKAHANACTHVHILHP
jgi:hypothetical protein